MSVDEFLDTLFELNPKLTINHKLIGYQSKKKGWLDVFGFVWLRTMRKDKAPIKTLDLAADALGLSRKDYLLILFAVCNDLNSKAVKNIRRDLEVLTKD